MILALAEAEGATDAVDDGAGSDDAAGGVTPALDGGAVTIVGGGGGGTTFGFGARPKRCGAFHMTIPSPHTQTRSSMMANTATFCRVEGPRLRTTTVGLFGRRGRSGIRMVSGICPGLGRPPSPGGTGNGIGVLTGDDAGAATIPPCGELIGGCARCGPEDG